MPPSHLPGEWPTSANEHYLLQKLSLFRVAAFFIADIGNDLILSCSSEFESSVCSHKTSPGRFAGHECGLSRGRSRRRRGGERRAPEDRVSRRTHRTAWIVSWRN